LSTPQVDIVKAIYDGARREDNNARIYPGFEPGAESHTCNWPFWMTGKYPGASPCGFIGAPHPSWQALYGDGFFAYFVKQDPSYDIHNLPLDGQIDTLDTNFGDRLNAIDPDLHAFRDHGGKLIQYHGWDDDAVAPRNSIEYWSQVETKMKSVVPGFSHADLD